MPDDIPASKLIDGLQNHVHYMHINPHMVKYESIPAPTDPAPTIPASRNVTATSEPDCYRVTDKVQTLPAGLWDSDVVSTYEFMNVENGVFVRIRSPMSVLMESLWRVRETDEGKFELVEEQIITASRLLVSTVKSISESGWKGLHASMLKKAQQ